MNWFKKILGIGRRKPKDEVVTDDKDNFVVPPISKLPEHKVDPNRKIRKCGVCEDNILPDERITKLSGHYFHQSCFKKEKGLYAV